MGSTLSFILLGGLGIIIAVMIYRFISKNKGGKLSMSLFFTDDVIYKIETFATFSTITECVGLGLLAFNRGVDPFNATTRVFFMGFLELLCTFFFTLYVTERIERYYVTLPHEKKMSIKEVLIAFIVGSLLFIVSVFPTWIIDKLYYESIGLLKLSWKYSFYPWNSLRMTPLQNVSASPEIGALLMIWFNPILNLIFVILYVIEVKRDHADIYVKRTLAYIKSIKDEDKIKNALDNVNNMLASVGKPPLGTKTTSTPPTSTAPPTTGTPPSTTPPLTSTPPPTSSGSPASSPASPITTSVTTSTAPTGPPKTPGSVPTLVNFSSYSWDIPTPELNNGEDICGMVTYLLLGDYTKGANLFAEIQSKAKVSPEVLAGTKNIDDAVKEILELFVGNVQVAGGRNIYAGLNGIKAFDAELKKLCDDLDSANNTLTTYQEAKNNATQAYENEKTNNPSSPNLANLLISKNDAEAKYNSVRTNRDRLHQQKAEKVKNDGRNSNPKQKILDKFTNQLSIMSIDIKTL